jgi:hypothetical protein
LYQSTNGIFRAGSVLGVSFESSTYSDMPAVQIQRPPFRQETFDLWIGTEFWKTVLPYGIEIDAKIQENRCTKNSK